MQNCFFSINNLRRSEPKSRMTGNSIKMEGLSEIEYVSIGGEHNLVFNSSKATLQSAVQ